MKIKRAIQQLLRDESKLNDLVKTAFRAVDEDDSGEIDEEELYMALKQVPSDEADGEPLSLEDVKSAMSELDTCNDGRISEEEFKALVLASLQFLHQREQAQS